MSWEITPCGPDGEEARRVVEPAVQRVAGDSTTDEGSVTVCTGEWFLAAGPPATAAPVVVVDRRGDDAVVAAVGDEWRATYVAADSPPRQVTAAVRTAMADTTQIRRQAAAMDASLTGIAVVDAAGQYVYMNEAHADIFGTEPETLVGETWRTIYDDRRVAYIEREVFPAVEATGVWEGELVGQRLDGTAVPQQVHLTKLADGGLVCVNRDTTAELHRRERLSAIRDRVETLMLATSRETVVEELLAATNAVVGRQLVGYWRHDPDTDTLKPVDASPAAEELPVPMPTFERGEGLIWSAFRAGSLQYHSDLRRNDDRYNPETPLRSELIVPVGDHGVVMVASRTTADFDRDERELMRILASHTETALRLADRRAELRRAAERITAQRRQLRALIDHIPQLVYAVDGDGEVVLANEAAASVHDTTVEALERDGSAELVTRAADDRRVLVDGETVHRSNETVAAGDGSRRVLDVWKVPFRPADSDERAVLHVATDVTDHRRRRKLAALDRIGSQLVAPEGDVHATAAQATRTALDATSVTVYRFVDGLLRTAGTDSERDTGTDPERDTGTDPERDLDASRDPAVIGPDNPLWSAFGTGETTGDETDAGYRLATPIDEFGLLVVTGGSDADRDVAFVETAAATTAAALRQARQKRRLERLNETLRQTNVELRRTERLAVGFREAHERLRDAATPEDVYRTVVEFASLTGEEAWVSRWEAGENRLDPVVVGRDGGPAAPQEPPSPGVTAVRRDEPVVVSNTTREPTYEEWAARLLTFGYQSAITVPLAHDGVVQGALDVVATTADAFGEERRRYLLAVCRAAAERLTRLATAGDAPTAVEIDLACDGLVFPGDPPSSSVTRAFFGSARTLVVEGTARTDPTAYFADTPGFTEPTVVPTDDGYAFEVRIVDGPERPITALRSAARSHDAVIEGVETDGSRESITVRLPPGTGGSFRERLVDAVTDCRLVAKRPVAATRQSSAALVDSLTDRQREILSAAYQLGYYDSPKRIGGDGLAERFDVSRSTVHQHLRAAERKVLGGVFDPHD
ncbi:MAG: GAF domain-containing protein [Halobaculum sp.]